MKEVDLSIIITAHSEGILLNRTIRNVLDSVDLLKQKNISYEIIVHVDSGNKDTLACVEKNKKLLDYVYKNNFSSLSKSRNFAVKKSHGKYIAFIDGDDLVSKNWFLEGYILANQNKKYIIHPEFQYFFNERLKPSFLRIQKDMKEEKSDIKKLVSSNLWASTVIASKVIFEIIPYNEESQYSPEDWHFNCETIASGYIHKISKNTALFYRVKQKGSLNIESTNQKKELAPTQLFSPTYYCSQIPLNSTPIDQTNQVPEKNFIYYYKQIRNNKYANFFISPVAKIGKKITKKPLVPVHETSIPENSNSFLDILKESMFYVAVNFEPLLYPYEEILKNIIVYDGDDEKAGECYRRLLDSFVDYPKEIIIVSEINKEIKNIIDSRKEKTKIAIIKTGFTENDDGIKLNGIDLYDFGDILKDSDERTKNQIFARLIVQLKCSKYHIINSDFAYYWFSEHENLVLKNKYHIVATILSSKMPNTEFSAVFACSHLLEKIFTKKEAEKYLLEVLDIPAGKIQ